MTTKLEGPAQEPRIEPTCQCGHLERWHDTNGAVCEYRGCQCAHFRDVNAAESSPPVPAPAPSQPMSAVRMDEMGVDDVAIDATMFRFERMDEQTFWLCAYRGDKHTTFTMWTQGGKLYCRRDDDELGTIDDSENPVIPESQRHG